MAGNVDGFDRVIIGVDFDLSSVDLAVRDTEKAAKDMAAAFDRALNNPQGLAGFGQQSAKYLHLATAETKALTVNTVELATAQGMLTGKFTALAKGAEGLRGVLRQIVLLPLPTTIGFLGRVIERTSRLGIAIGALSERFGAATVGVGLFNVAVGGALVGSVALAIGMFEHFKHEAMDVLDNLDKYKKAIALVSSVTPIPPGILADLQTYKDSVTALNAEWDRAAVLLAQSWIPNIRESNAIEIGAAKAVGDMAAAHERFKTALEVQAPWFLKFTDQAIRATDVVIGFGAALLANPVLAFLEYSKVTGTAAQATDELAIAAKRASDAEVALALKGGAAADKLEAINKAKGEEIAAQAKAALAREKADADAFYTAFNARGAQIGAEQRAAAKKAAAERAAWIKQALADSAAFDKAELARVKDATAAERVYAAQVEKDRDADAKALLEVQAAQADALHSYQSNLRDSVTEQIALEQTTAKTSKLWSAIHTTTSQDAALREQAAIAQRQVLDTLQAQTVEINKQLEDGVDSVIVAQEIQLANERAAIATAQVNQNLRDALNSAKADDWKRTSDTIAQMAQGGQDLIGALDLGKKRTKELEGLTKSFALTQVIVSGASAAVAALSPPPIGAGPIFGPLLAAGIVASTVASAIATIRGSGSGNTQHHTGEIDHSAPQYHSAPDPMARYSHGPDERTVTITHAERVMSPRETRERESSRGPTTLVVPFYHNNKLLDSQLFALAATGRGTLSGYQRARRGKVGSR